MAIIKETKKKTALDRAHAKFESLINYALENNVKLPVSRMCEKAARMGLNTLHNYLNEVDIMIKKAIKDRK